jgi:hypothetical protein
MRRHVLVALLDAALVCAIPRLARAFCGFYASPGCRTGAGSGGEALLPIAALLLTLGLLRGGRSSRS